MAPRGRAKEVALQESIETQDEWDNLMLKDGLTVVDVYQEWCGPCKAVVSSFKKIKNELGDELLRFAVAKADTIDHLEKYRGTCEPCFLFFASGYLVEVIRGVEGPKLSRSILEQLAQEHKVLEGAAERREIFDPKFPPTAKVDVDDSEGEEEESSSDEDDDDLDVEPPAQEGDLTIGGEIINYSQMPARAKRRKRGRVYLSKTSTVLIILPDVATDERVPDILAKIESSGMEIIHQEERELTADEVKEIYASESKKEMFESFSEFLTGEPSILLCISRGKFGDDVIPDLVTLTGPPTVKEAKAEDPECLRAVYGNSENFLSPAFYVSADAETAKRDLQLFFPEQADVKSLLEHPVVEKKPKLLAIMTSAAMTQYGPDGFMQKVSGSGFTTLYQKITDISKSKAEQFFKKIKDSPEFHDLVESISSGTVFILAVTKEGSQDAGADWNHLIGPKTLDEINDTPHCLRAQFLVRGEKMPSIYCSENLTSGQREVGFFFPMQEVLIVIKPHAVKHTDEILHRIRRESFQIVDMKEIKLQSSMVADLYRTVIRKPFYKQLVKKMTSGPSVFIMALKIDGISQMRAILGNTNPEEARAENPNSIE